MRISEIIQRSTNESMVSGGVATVAQPMGTVRRRRKSKKKIAERIRKQGNKYVVQSEDGSRNFGTYTSRKDAEKRLRQVEYFKHQGS